jgi:hypothetical protein
LTGGSCSFSSSFSISAANFNSFWTEEVEFEVAEELLEELPDDETEEPDDDEADDAAELDELSLDSLESLSESLSLELLTFFNSRRISLEISCSCCSLIFFSCFSRVAAARISAKKERFISCRRVDMFRLLT